MAEVALFDKNGAHVGWYEDKPGGADLFYDVHGHRKGYSPGGKFVFGFSGGQKAVFLSGYLCDKHGNPVAFITTAQGDPVNPATTEPANRPDKFDNTPVGTPQTATFAPSLKPEWSETTFADLFA